MTETGWVSSKFESNKLVAEDEVQRTEHKQAEQTASEQHLTLAWQNLIAAVTADIAEWNLLKSKKHLQLKTTPWHTGIHYDGQLGFILDLQLDRPAGSVRFSAPTQQANNWRHHNGELGITPDATFLGPSGARLNSEQASQFLLEPVLFA
jgi:hypothetical protein